MTSDRDARHRAGTLRAWWNRIASIQVRALLTLGLVVGFGAIATTAYWVSADGTATPPISSGVLHIDLGSNVQVKPEQYGWTAMAVTDILPGTGTAAMISVTNNSTPDLALEYQIKGRTSGTTDAGLLVSFRKGGAVSGTPGTLGASCTGGTVIGTADTRLTATMTTLVSAQQNLLQGATDQICVQVRMAMDTPNAMQGQARNILLEFPARSVPR